MAESWRSTMATDSRRSLKTAKAIDLQKARRKAVAKSPAMKKLKKDILRDLYLWATKK